MCCFKSWFYIVYTSWSQDSLSCLVLSEWIWVGISKVKQCKPSIHWLNQIILCKLEFPFYIHSIPPLIPRNWQENQILSLMMQIINHQVLELGNPHESLHVSNISLKWVILVLATMIQPCFFLLRVFYFIEFIHLIKFFNLNQQHQITSCAYTIWIFMFIHSFL